MRKISNSGSFNNFYLNNLIYVDKTETIYNLISNEQRIFISRPRRFGKSLTLDTIGTLFEYGVDPYFKGTWIYDKWTEPTYPVLRLNLVEYEMSDLTEFKIELTDDITAFAKKHHVSGYIESNKPYIAIKNLLVALNDEQRQIVI